MNVRKHQGAIKKKRVKTSTNNILQRSTESLEVKSQVEKQF